LSTALETNGMRYVIVSPVRDEEQYIGYTIRSIIRQTIRPVEWIIVDDGSNDSTGRIIDDYAKQYPWITAIHRSDRGQRIPGTGVMEAFYDGYRCLKTSDWTYLAKLDGDLGLEQDYFESCFERFHEDSRLGICGGVIYSSRNKQLEPEFSPMFHVRGAVKLYRRSCWMAIGCLMKAPGWDTVDELQAARLGWRTRSFSHIRVIQYRATGAVQGAWLDGVKNGRANYIVGYHPVFMFTKCVKRLFQRPFVIDALAHAYGFITGYCKRLPRVGDRELIRYIREQQIRRLLLMDSMWQ
jgi:poly-beta-1,6-N-acetyl-D-glucosamine synthase